MTRACPESRFGYPQRENTAQYRNLSMIHALNGSRYRSIFAAGPESVDSIPQRSFGGVMQTRWFILLRGWVDDSVANFTLLVERTAWLSEVDPILAPGTRLLRPGS